MNVGKLLEQSRHGAHLGLRVRGVGRDEIRAALVGEVAGEITDGLEAFANAEVRIDQRLEWAANAGLKWRW